MTCKMALSMSLSQGNINKTENDSAWLRPKGGSAVSETGYAAVNPKGPAPPLTLKNTPR